MRSSRVLLAIVVSAGLLSASALMAAPGSAVAAAATPVQAKALDLNDYELLVQASGNGPNAFGWAPIVAVVTYQGAGIPGLTASQFSVATNAQIVPPGGSALVLNEKEFHDQGGGRYYLGAEPFDDNWLIGTYHFVLKADARSAYKASGMTIVVIDNGTASGGGSELVTPGLTPAPVLK